MFSFNDILEKIEQEIAQLQFTCPPKSLYDPIEYILSLGGKRIRPALVLMACNLYKDNVDTALKPALGLEVFHNFTLLHDDLMDEADKRRNKPTVHKVWNANTAILSGDAMLIAASQLIGETKSESLKEILDLFTVTALEICGGQQYDMEFERTDREVSEAEYLEMIRLKTSVLLAAALEMGAIVGGASPAERRALYDFGVNLGLAFQIQDDLLDTYGDAETFGKAIGGDIAVGKKTFLHIAAMAAASAEQRAAIWAPGDLDEKLLRVRGIYDALGVRSAAEAAIERYFTRALASLRRAHEDASRLAVLEKYAYSLLKRTK